MPIHARLKILRDDKGMKQEEVAKYLGITQQAYSNYELGKRDIPAYHIVSLSKLYQVSTDYLLETNPGRAGIYELNNRYIQNITLNDVMLKLNALNSGNRYNAINYITYLYNMQRRG